MLMDDLRRVCVYRPGFFVCLLAAAIVPVVSHAQSSTGELRVAVKDPSGAFMQASVALQNVASGVLRSSRTGVEGSCTFTDLPFGRYQLTVSRQGFASQSLLEDVSTTQPISRTVTMAIGPTSMTVDVVATTPLPGTDESVDSIPAPVQVAAGAELQASGALDVSDFLNRRFNAVFANEIQGNPFQPDLNYRGYTASPLLGTPQGLSVYMDGVRMNQPFGEAVNWDVIPSVAIGSTTLMPGSNPLFGLNTLGGALSIQTKDGLTSPGTTVRAVYGSDARRSVEFEHGGHRASGINWYLAGNVFKEDGWRDDSPSDVGQLFGKLGWRQAKGATALSVGWADNSLYGNGLQEQRFLARDYASVYTKPDITDDRATFLNLTTRYDWSPTFSFSGNVYYRHIKTNTFNGDINDDSLDQSVYQPSAAEIAALTAAGYSGFPTSGANASNTPFPYWRCIGQVLLRDEPGEKCDGLLNRSDTSQNNFGLSGQGTRRNWLRSGNSVTVGAGYDGGRSSFSQSSQLAYMNPDRGFTGLNAFADGVTGGHIDGVPFDNRVNLDGRVNTGSVFASDVLAIRDALTVTLSARFNRTSITNIDRLTPGGGAGSLDGEHTFSRLNPAAGVTYSPTRDLNLYFGYNEGSRAPTSIELGCADPSQPCKLPNAMVGDPPLDQVVTRTVEGGVRTTRGALTWSAGFFHADNSDDILFVASNTTGFGYFKNVGRTRRQGIELGLNGRVGRVSAGAGYTLLDATFQSEETLDGTGNSTNDAGRGLEGTIDIASGDRMPLIPRHMFKAHADVQISSRIGVDLGVIAASGLIARGDENNAHQPDGIYYLGPGSTPAYGIANLGVRCDLSEWLQLIAQVNNIFDTTYYTAAQLGGTGFSSSGGFIARPFPAVAREYPIQQATFYAPGAPIRYWIGTRVRF
jgi:outer membrane receptor protein involved in Fe transport